MKVPSFGAAGALTLCLVSTSVWANSTGITGYSGKQGATVTCTICHMGGTAPTVEITGPTSLAAGAKGDYVLIIKGGAGVKGGLNVAVDNAGASLEAGAGSRKAGGELTHVSPKSFSGGEVRFDFSMVAPSSAGTVKIFGAGNSVNGDANSTLDLSGLASLSVTVTGGTTTPDPVAEEDKGCSAVGGAPSLLWSLVAVGLTRLRRRRD